MIIPTVPSFSTGACSVGSLQSLSNAVNYISCGNNFPIWRFVKSAPMSPTAGSWQTVPYNTVEFDSDNVHYATNGGVQLNTQGYYYVESSLSVKGLAGTNNVLSFTFLWTAGGSNPNYASGTASRFGGATLTAGTGVTVDYSMCQADMVPVVCYPGDSIVVQIYPAVACTTDTLTNLGTTPGFGCFSPQFSGRWLRAGS